MNLHNLHKILIAIVLIVTITSCTSKSENKLHLSNAAILISPSIKTPVYKTTGKILVEEIEKRTSLQLELAKNWDNKTIIACALSEDKNLFGEVIPKRDGDNLPESKKEGFRLFYEIKNGKEIVWIIGADERGILYGIGKLLRIAEMKEGKITVAKWIDISTSPEYPIRGHQFGYRNTANSWDAWTVEQFDQHFREQVLFGANSFENIPFQEPNSSPHFKVNPKEMEVQLSKICDSYDADFWGLDRKSVV